MSEDWTQGYDESSGAYYYVNNATGESSWDMPEGFVAPTTEDSVAEATNEEASDAAYVSESTPSIWQEVHDEASGQSYYVNTVTGDSSWDKPENFGEEKIDAQAEEQPQSDTATEAGAGTVGPSNTPESDPLNWEAIWDEGSQAYYYMNHVTQETQWDIPECLNEEANKTDTVTQGVDGDAGELANSTANDKNNSGRSDLVQSSGNQEGSKTTDTSGAASSRNGSSDNQSSSTNFSKVTFQDGFAFSLLDSENGSHEELEPEVSKMQNKHRKRQSQIMADLMDHVAHVDEPKANHAVGKSEDLTPVSMKEKALGNSSLRASLDVTSLTANITLADISKILSDIDYAEFVEKHFLLPSASDSPEGGSSNAVNSSNSASASAPDKLSNNTDGVVTMSARERLMSWQGEPIGMCLCVLNDPERVEAAVNINKAIMGFMGDKATNKSPSELVYQILAVALSDNLELGDEIYCQIVKQVTNNPSTDSELQGWYLLTILLACSPPSAYYSPYLMKFFVNAAKSARGSRVFSPAIKDVNLDSIYEGDFLMEDDSIGKAESMKLVEIAKIAELCIRYTIKSIKCSTKRTHAPTEEEIEALKSGETMTISVRLVDNTIVNIPLDSWSTVLDCELRLATHLQIKDENRCIFALHELIKNSGVSSRTGYMPGEFIENHLQGFERIADVLSFHFVDHQERHIQRQIAESRGLPLPIESSYPRFLYKARIFIDNTESGSFSADMDSACTYLLYKQGINDVLASKYPLAKEEAVTLAALQMQEEHGDYENLVKKLGFETTLKKSSSEKRVSIAITDAQLEEDEAALSLLGLTYATGTDARIDHSSNETKTSRGEDSAVATGVRDYNDKGDDGNGDDDVDHRHGDDDDDDDSQEPLCVRIFETYPVETFLAKHYMGRLVDEAKRELAEIDVLKIYSRLQSLSVDDARVAYMTVLRNCRCYGAHYFKISQQVERVSETAEVTDKVMAITSREVIVINPSDLTYESLIHFKEIKTWGYSLEALMLDVIPKSTQVLKSKGNASWLEKVPSIRQYYRTSNAKNIADLLKLYSVYST